MARIPCFWLEPTDEVEVQLRRYTFAYPLPDEQKCPISGSYHNALAFLQKEPAEFDPDDPLITCNGLKPAPAHDDPRWPTRCACGYTFQETDEWQRWTERLFRDVAGKKYTLSTVPAGAMWYAPWEDRFYTPQREHCLVVQTPGGLWTIDAQARNCTLKEDRQQKEHHCWVIEGEPPAITVGKNGKTCNAGAGSIQCGTYHGFLRNGFLED